MNVIEVSGVRVRHRRGAGISGVSFTAAPGERIALFGGVGSGKTTILRLLAGRLSPEAGTVRVLGHAPRGAAKLVGYAPEPPPYASIFTPHQILGQQLARQDAPASQRTARLVEMLELCGLYAHRNRPARELSRGQQTVLAMATALVLQPAVLLLDNLMAALPSPLAGGLRAYLDARRAADGLTVIQATTDSEEAERADRVLMLDAGRPLAFASPADLLAGQPADTLVVEAADPEAVQRTLRGIFDVEIAETRDGLRFSTADGLAATAHLFRHPAGGVRAVYLRRPTLWDVLERLKG